MKRTAGLQGCLFWSHQWNPGSLGNCHLGLSYSEIQQSDFQVQTKLIANQVIFPKHPKFPGFLPNNSDILG